VAYNPQLGEIIRDPLFDSAKKIQTILKFVHGLIFSQRRCLPEFATLVPLLRDEKELMEQAGEVVDAIEDAEAEPRGLMEKNWNPKKIEEQNYFYY